MYKLPLRFSKYFYHNEACHLQHLQVHVSFQFTCILRGLLTQNILCAAGFSLGFYEATVIQKRNPHHYLTDFESEILSYLYLENINDVVNRAA